MKISSKVKKMEVINPFRPKIGIPHENESCVIRVEDLPHSIDPEFCVVIDCCGKLSFVAAMFANIPEWEVYYDIDKECYFTMEKHYDTVVKLAEKYYVD